MPLSSIDLKKYIPRSILNFLPKFKKFLRLLLISFLSITVISFWAMIYFVFSDGDFSDSQQPVKDTEYAACNVLKIKMQGNLLSYIPYEGRNESGGTSIDANSSENIVAAIEYADKDESIKACQSLEKLNRFLVKVKEGYLIKLAVNFCGACNPIEV